MLEKIISGGQTGVDRAALDAAMALGIDAGGWCPKGRRAVDGAISSKYPLKETPGGSYKIRTLWNVRDSDATLIVCRDEPSGGTALTIDYCKQLGRPYEVCQLKGGEVFCQDGPGSNPVDLVDSLNRHAIKILNVAGPREGKSCPIYDRAYHFLHEVFQLMQEV
jgi:hypothetical protein